MLWGFFASGYRQIAANRSKYPNSQTASAEDLTIRMTLSLEFAFEGFRIIRQRPKLILFWGAFSFLGYGALALLLIGKGGMALNDAGRLMSTSSSDPQAAVAAMQQVMPALRANLPLYALLAAIYLLISTVLNAAICRVVQGDSDDRFGFLAFGRKEFLLLALEIVMVCLRFAIVIGCLLSGAILAQSLPNDAAEVVLELLMLVAMGIVAWLSVRLLLNMAQTFEEGRLNIFGSFALTHGLFWPLLAGYATAFGLAVVVMFLCDRVIDGVLIVGFGASATGGVPGMVSMATFLTPSHIVELVLTYGVMSPLTTAIIVGAPLAAYRQIRARRGPVTA